MMRSADLRKIDVPAVLDVEAIERALNDLWRESAGENHAGGEEEESAAMLRTRVLNLMIYVSTEAALDEVSESLSALVNEHPCRALLMLGEETAADRDIEMYVGAQCTNNSAVKRRHVCGEQVILKARGCFVPELPSAAVPLLISDLPVFLYWRNPHLDFNDPSFLALSRASDRVIIDTALSPDSARHLIALADSFQREEAGQTAFTDLNWSRLTHWRALLAGFYDVREYRAALDAINHVRIEYFADANETATIATEALMIGGWITNRLNWRTSSARFDEGKIQTHLLSYEKEGRPIQLEFLRRERKSEAHGGLARVELRAESQQSAESFSVVRSEDGSHLETSVEGGTRARVTRTLACEAMDETALLAAELALTARDKVYEGAVTTAAEILRVTGVNHHLSTKSDSQR